MIRKQEKRAPGSETTRNRGPYLNKLLFADLSFVIFQLMYLPAAKVGGRGQDARHGRKGQKQR